MQGEVKGIDLTGVQGARAREGVAEGEIEVAGVQEAGARKRVAREVLTLSEEVGAGGDLAGGVECGSGEAPNSLVN